jgi:hypothetical protein
MMGDGDDLNGPTYVAIHYCEGKSLKRHATDIRRLHDRIAVRRSTYLIDGVPKFGKEASA